MTKQKRESTGKTVAAAALLLGGTMSVAANSLHVIYVTGPATGGVSVPQVIGAAFWPIALILAVEVMTRVKWPHSKAYAVLRWGGVGAVATVAAIVSYGHMYHLLRYWGESWLTAALGPIGVDGLVTVGAVGLMAASHATAPPTTAPAATETAQVNPAKAPAPEPKASPEPSPPAPSPQSISSEPPADKVTAAPDGATAKPAAAAITAEVLAEVPGLPASLRTRAADQLNKVVADGRTPTADDLKSLGLPASMNAKVINACNGSLQPS